MLIDDVFIELDVDVRILFDENQQPSISTEFTYKGIDAAFLENEHLRIFLLTGKGGDILVFRDKQRDVNVLWNADHNWVPPDRRYIPSQGPNTWQTDHFPGGWQVNIPLAGYSERIGDAPYGLHGESALVPWEFEVVQDTADAVTLQLSTDLVRYPFSLARELTLPADKPVLEITESITNEGGVELEYMWQQHISLGRPLVGPHAHLDIPAATGHVENYDGDFPNARLESGASFDWPDAPGPADNVIDLSEDFPPRSAEVHDVAFATELTDGWYALTNRDLDLGFGFQFPEELFESVWYWQPFGGFEASPYYKRNYNVGVEPTTAYPSIDIPEAQRATGTMKTLAPGKSVKAEFIARTYTGYESVTKIGEDGSIEGVSPNN